jgi:uncharacterized protein (TIGR02231 family)
MKQSKISSLAAVMILASAFAVFAQEIQTDSRIAEVMVYPDSAMIYRVANVKAAAGEQKVVFADIIPEIDENSLRVSAEGNSAVRLFGAQVKREFLEEVPTEKIKQLQEEIQKKEDEQRSAQNTKNLLLEEKNFLDSLRFYSREQLPKELITKMPSPAELDSTYKFLDVKLRENYAAVMDCEIKIREINSKIDVLRRELAQISGPVRKQKRSIIVDMEVLKAGAFDIKVSYLVRGAGWQPIYDARADFLKSEVELFLYGLLRQRTGEDWQDVGISLSTARPSIGGNLPYVAPWVLRPFQPRVWEEKTRFAAGSVAQKMAFVGDSMENEALPSAAPVYSSPEEKGTSVVYKLARRATIKSDGSENKLPISTQNLKANFEYSTYPRAVTLAYLGSRVKNAPQLQLMPGRVNIFLDGDFVGASNLGNIGPGEEFDLYLGADENVKVKRELIDKKVDETLIGSIASPDRTIVFKYKLTVENYKSKKIKAKLFEAMPVSENDKIKVKMGQVSLEPKVKDWQQRNGVWLWELELEPQAKKEITYSFTVVAPRDLQIEGL